MSHLCEIKLYWSRLTAELFCANIIYYYMFILTVTSRVNLHICHYHSVALIMSIECFILLIFMSYFRHFVYRAVLIIAVKERWLSCGCKRNVY